MAHSSKTFIFVFAAIFAFCLFSSSVAQVADFQQDELYAFLNSRYPNLYNRALRSMGKPTFIRFGKRSSAASASLDGQQQQQHQPQYPFAQQQQLQQQWAQ